MKNFSKVMCMALPLLVCACQSDQSFLVADEGNGVNNVEMKISMNHWNPESETRTTGNMLYPINIFYAGSDNVVHNAATINEGTEFSITVHNGSYELYAVCGLDGSCIPENISSPITIPEAGKNEKPGKKDFATAKTKIKVENGKCTPTMVNLNANREMSWLDVSINNVTSDVKSLKLYAKGFCQEYSFKDNWVMNDDAAKRFHEIVLSQNHDTKTTYESSLIIEPQCGDDGISFITEVKYADNVVKYYKGESNIQLTSGKHLSLKLNFANFCELTEDVAITEDWVDASDETKITEIYNFDIGEQYFTKDATVFDITEKAIYLMSHIGTTFTLSALKDAFDNKTDITYNAATDVPVNSWVLPQKASVPESILKMIKEISWDGFCQNFLNSGQVPIKKDATNVLAYYLEGKFYRFDFQKMEIVQVDGNSTETFVVFPVGAIIQSITEN